MSASLIEYIDSEEDNNDIQTEDQIKSLTTIKKSYSCPEITQATSEDKSFTQAFHFNLQDVPRHMKMEKEVDDESKSIHCI